MVDIRKAIDLLQAHKEFLQIERFIPHIPICEALEMAIQALYEKAERKSKE